MVFSSVTFLFLFLPIVLVAFWLTPARWRTPLLVAASWIFYAWGEKALVALLVVSALFNWSIAIAIAAADGRAAGRDPHFLRALPAAPRRAVNLT